MTRFQSTSDQESTLVDMEAQYQEMEEWAKKMIEEMDEFWLENKALRHNAPDFVENEHTKGGSHVLGESIWTRQTRKICTTNYIAFQTNMWKWAKR